jgi:hypothetical protein
MAMKGWLSADLSYHMTEYQLKTCPRKEAQNDNFSILDIKYYMSVV